MVFCFFYFCIYVMSLIRPSSTIINFHSKLILSQSCDVCKLSKFYDRTLEKGDRRVIKTLMNLTSNLPLPHPQVYYPVYEWNDVIPSVLVKKKPDIVLIQLYEGSKARPIRFIDDCFFYSGLYRIDFNFF